MQQEGLQLYQIGNTRRQIFSTDLLKLCPIKKTMDERSSDNADSNAATDDDNALSETKSKLIMKNLTNCEDDYID